MLTWLRRRQAVVLMYHGFTDRPSDGVVNYQGNRLQQETFRRQLAWLRQNRAIVPLRAVVDSLTGGPPLPDYATALSIDDGYESVHALGFPVLKEFDAPATLFVATQFIDERLPLWPDRLEYAFAGAPGEAAARRERLKGLQARAKGMLPAERDKLIGGVEEELGRRLVLQAGAPENYRAVTWEQCRVMAESGLVEIGSHTHTHTITTLLDDESLKRELSLSRNLVEKSVGKKCDLFCYPNGDYDDFSAETTAALKTAGFACGLTTVAGFVKPGSDPHTMLRFGTDDRDSFAKFTQTFSLGRNLLQSLKRRFGL